MSSDHENPKAKQSSIWFVVGMALVGLTTGSFVGLSRSPVVGIVLPLLFALIGGAGGTFLAKADLSSAAGRQRLRLIGQSVGALSLLTLLSCAIVVFLRYSPPRTSLSAIQGLQSLSADELLKLAELRIRLQLLGSSPAEQKLILEQSIAKNTRPKQSLRASNVRSLWNVCVSALQTLQKAQFASDNSDASLKIGRLEITLTGYCPEIDQIATQIEAGSDVDPGQLSSPVSAISLALSNVVFGGNIPLQNDKVLLDHPDVLSVLTTLHRALDHNFDQNKARISFTTEPPSNSDNDFLKIILSVGPERTSQSFDPGMIANNVNSSPFQNLFH